MGLTSLFRVPITIQRAASTEDAYGGAGTEKSWATPTTATVFGEVQPVNMRGRADQERPDVNLTVGGWVAYLPPSADVAAGDRLVANGSTFEVDGEPHVWRRLGVAHHITVPLKLVTAGA